MLSIHSSNHMLAALTAPDRNALLPHLKVVELPQELVLFDAGDPIKAFYCPHMGIVSLVVDLTSGDMIEAAMIGQDGVVGGFAALDGDLSLNKAVVQLTGRASVVDVDRVRALAESSVVFRTALMRHEQFVMAQAQQSAACNRSEEHTSELQSLRHLVCRLLLEKKKTHSLLSFTDILIRELSVQKIWPLNIDESTAPIEITYQCWKS